MVARMAREILFVLQAKAIDWREVLDLATPGRRSWRWNSIITS